MRLTRRQMTAPLREDGAFADWYVENFMRSHLPQFYWSLSPEGRTEMVTNGREYARHFGFVDPVCQMQFITLMWTLGANFFVFDGFRQIAEDVTGDEAQRIAAFYDVDPDLAAQAVMNPDDRYWYPRMVTAGETRT